MIVYLVTSYIYFYNDSFNVEGIFSTLEKAKGKVKELSEKDTDLITDIETWEVI